MKGKHFTMNWGAWGTLRGLGMDESRGGGSRGEKKWVYDNGI